MRIFSLALSLLVSSVSVLANTSLNGVQGVTRLSMGYDVGNGIIAAAPASRVRVPPMECVIISSLPQPAEPGQIGSTGPFQWTKDGELIEGATEPTLLIPLATSADSGYYGVAGLDWPFVATGIHLDVVAEGHLGNYSNRVELAAGDAVAIAGFVVDGTKAKTLMVRGVGPSLTQFSITNPIARPVIQIFNALGERIDQVVRILPIWDFPTWFAEAGAFQLLDEGYGTAEQLDTAFGWWEFEPGSYTVHLRDESQAGGVGLIEIYEVSGMPPTKQ